MDLLEGIGGLGLHKTHELAATGMTIIPGRNHGLVVDGITSVDLKILLEAVLTSTGREVFSLLDIGDEQERLERLAGQLQKDSVSKIWLGLVQREGPRLSCTRSRIIWEQQAEETERKMQPPEPRP